MEVFFCVLQSKKTEFKDLLRVTLVRFEALSSFETERRDQKDDFFKLPLGVAEQLMETSEAG